MNRAFRIKPIASNLPADHALPEDLRKQFTEMYFTQPTDLELGTLDERSITNVKADMLKLLLPLMASDGIHETRTAVFAVAVKPS